VKVLIATPCFGGLLTYTYTKALIETLHGCMQNRIPVAPFFLANESLIGRGRNTCAAFALKHGFSHLFFIDADIGWKFSDFSKVLGSGKQICGGFYPIKQYPLSLNHNEFEGTEVRPGAEELIEVAHLATGFLCIDVRVLRKLINAGAAPKYRTLNKASGETAEAWDLFPSGEHGGEYESEDWAFCRIARDHGERIFGHSGVILTHTGTHTFDFRSPPPQTNN